jgi:tripartite-type tricarboxylate transporter receptor subunit TctC
MKRLSRDRRVPLLMSVSALALALTACGAAGSTGGDGGGEGGVDFGGANVEILVPTGAGGGTDTTARFVGEEIADNFEAEPNVQIVNVDGASHIVGMNQYETKEPHDGLHWLMTSGSGHLPYIFGEKAVQFDLAEMKPILASPVGNVVLVSTESGIKSIEQLRDAKLVYGGAGPVGSDTTQLLGLSMLGVDYEPIFGFDEGPQRIAFEQGEVDLIYNTTPAYLSGGKDLVDRGLATPLYTAGQLDENGEVIRDPAFPDLPSVAEVYEELNGEPPSGPEWEAYKALLATTTSFSKVMWLHGDAPADAVEQVRNATAEMVKDANFEANAEEILGGYDLMVGDTAAQSITEAFDVDPAAIEWLTEWLMKEFDADPSDAS